MVPVSRPATWSTVTACMEAVGDHHWRAGGGQVGGLVSSQAHTKQELAKSSGVVMLQCL